jgi:hypothetical protein
MFLYSVFPHVCYTLSYMLLVGLIVVVMLHEYLTLVCVQNTSLCKQQT